MATEAAFMRLDAWLGASPRRRAVIQRPGLGRALAVLRESGRPEPVYGHGATVAEAIDVAVTAWEAI